jgi:hypothetical protein
MAGKKDLNDFITHVKTIGLPTASHFQITLPSIGSVYSEEVSMLCDNVQLPGVNVLTHEVRTMGELSELPYGIVYPPVSMVFMLDNKFNAKNYFDTWSNLVYNRSNRTAGFYKTFTKDVTVEAIDKAGKTIFSITLIEAYPKNISNIDFGNGNHEVIKLNVDFVYRYWKETGKQEVAAKIPSTSALNNVIPGAGRITTDNFLNFPTSTNPMSTPFESLTKSPSNLSFDFVSNTPTTNIGSRLEIFGPTMGSDLKRGCKAVEANALSPSSGLPSGFGSSFGSTMSSVGNSINSVGSALGSIGRSIRNVTAPLAAIGGTVNSLSNSVGALDSLLSSVGIKNTGLRGISKELNKIGGDMGTLSNLGGFPGKLGSLGGTMNALGGSFETVKKSFDQFPNASKELKDSIGKLGSTFTKRGNETADAAGEMRTQIDNGVLNA